VRKSGMWYEELIKNGSVVTTIAKREILAKINETDPWYSFETLNSWIYGRRKSAKTKAGANDIPSKSVFVKIEEISTTFPARIVTVPKGNAFHVALDHIPQGNDTEIHELMGDFGVNTTLLIRHHSLPHSVKTPAKGGRTASDITLTCAPRSEVTLRESGSTSTWASPDSSRSSTACGSTADEFLPSQIASSIHNTKYSGEIPLQFTLGPPNHGVPQTFGQFSAQLEPYESELDNILEIMDQYS